MVMYWNVVYIKWSMCQRIQSIWAIQRIHSNGNHQKVCNFFSHSILFSYIYFMKLTFNCDNLTYSQIIAFRLNDWRLTICTCNSSICHEWYWFVCFFLSILSNVAYLDVILRGADESQLPEKYFAFLKSINHNDKDAHPELLTKLFGDEKWIFSEPNQSFWINCSFSKKKISEVFIQQDLFEPRTAGSWNFILLCDTKRKISS